MLFTTVVRWELARLGLGALARAVTYDREPTSADRSRSQHFRNGLGALLFVSSEVALHGNGIASAWHAVRNPARSELRYALSELREAELVSSGARFARRHAPALLFVTSAGLLRARASRA
jgi:uncharacterized membrane protein